MKRLMVLAFCLGFIPVVQADTEKEFAESRFSKYLECLKKDQFETASTYWTDKYIWEVYKFGLTYFGTPYKPDCTSPLLEKLADYKSGRLLVNYKATSTALNHLKITLSLKDSLQESQYEYFIGKGKDGNLYLEPRYWSIMQSLSVKESKYVKLYYFREILLNDFALDALDSAIDMIGSQLGLEQKAKDRLGADKLIYILCENQNQVKELSGSFENGYYDPATNLIITDYLPHGEMLAQFLAAYKISDCGLHVLPWIDHGMAVFLGGRAGATLDVFAQLVDFGLKSGSYKLEDILTKSDYESKTGGRDFSEPLAGYFVMFLNQQIGMEKLLTLYQQLSGDLNFVDSCSKTTVMNILNKVTGKSWVDLEKAFLAFFGNQVREGTLPYDKPVSGEIVYQSGTPKFSVAIYDNGEWYILDAAPVGKSSSVSGALLFNFLSQGSQSDYRSDLFIKHFSNLEYGQQAYGIIFNKDEIGIYNYFLDEIVSKCIISLMETPLSGTPGHVTFRFRKSLLGADLSKYKIQSVEIH